MDVQALFEGSVVLSDEDGPGRTEKCNISLLKTQIYTTQQITVPLYFL